MASPTSQTFLRPLSEQTGSSVSGSTPPAERTTFGYSYAGSSVSGSSPPHDQPSFNPYADVQQQASKDAAPDHSSYPASMTSASTMHGQTHGQQEDVYHERPKSSPAITSVAAEVQAPPPYSPHHQHSHSSPNAPFTVPSMGAAAA